MCLKIGDSIFIFNGDILVGFREVPMGIPYEIWINMVTQSGGIRGF